MNFVYPNFLWALLLLVIPVIIHLFNFRRYKTIYFSRVDILNEAIEDSKAGNKLKHLLVLITRMLAIAALVFAFSQPFIANQKTQNTETVSSIYIDNSFSLQAQGQDGNLLNEIKNKAIDLVNSFDENEKINLLTSDLLSKDQRFYTKPDIIERIKQIDFSPITTSLETATNLQLNLLRQNAEKRNKRLFILSDFQKSTTILPTLTDSSLQTFIYQGLPEIEGNIFIDSIWFESPVQSLNMPIELFFRVNNGSEQAVDNLTLTLKINEREKGVKSLKIGPQSYTIESISFSNNKPGLKKGEIGIKTGQLFFDDRFLFTYDIKDQTNILIVNGENQTNNDQFENLYAVNDFYNSYSVNISQLKQEDFNGQSFIIFNGVNTITSGAVNLLNEALETGASIVLIPGLQANLESWNQFLRSKNIPLLGQPKSLSTSLKFFNDEDPLFYGVFDKKPEQYIKTRVNRHYPLITNSQQKYITLFGISKSTPFLTYSQTEKSGKIVLQSAPLHEEFTNFDKHALFAATYLRLAETARFQKSLFYTIGQPSTYTLQSAIDEKKPIHLINKDYQTDIIPMTTASRNSQKIIFDKFAGMIKQAGFYELTNLDDFSETVAFNYDRVESKTACFSKDEIMRLFKEKRWEKTDFLELSEKGKIEIDNIKPKEYWRFFLILALIFLAIETALLKWWKTS